MSERLIELLDVLNEVKLLPRRSSEHGVAYGYVEPEVLAPVSARISRKLSMLGYEVHQCTWDGEVVLLAINNMPHPFAFRLTSSAEERYNLYALSRPETAQTLWQWAQAMTRQQLRQQRRF